MMKLLISQTSPYARAARMAVSVLNLESQVEMQIVNHRGYDEQLLARNPLGKVPTLILENEVVLFDSRVIVEYLYHLKGQAAYLLQDTDKFQSQTTLALAAGLMDCTIAAGVEKRNHDLGSQNLQWIERQEGKVARTLEYLDKAPVSSKFTPLPTADQIFMASALGYLDFVVNENWKSSYPILAKWLFEFSECVSSFHLTAPKS
nr:glutathione S-transferase N-terminal domain-containing protein [uncultured Cohaesibacter sp.]